MAVADGTAALDEVASARLAFFARDGEHALTRAEKLQGGLQNTNYKATTKSGNVVVVRIPAPDAAEHGQDQSIVCANARAAAACGVAPAVLDYDADQGVIVTRFITGTTLTKSALAADASGHLLSAFVGERRRLWPTVLIRVRSLSSSRWQPFSLF